MSNIDPSTATTYANLDWDHYVQSRPPYPQSLRDVIYNYRRTHPKALWERLVDVGSGVGIASTIFASDFNLVYLLDHSPQNNEKARVFLGEWVQRHSLKTKLEITESTAEEGHEFVKDADLLICATTAHFIDPDSLITSAARMLRPGGTLAICSYMVPVFPDQSKHFSDTFCKAVTRTIGLCIPPGDEDAKSLLSRATARISAGDGLLDSVPVPKEFFEDVQRVHINPDAEKVMDIFRSSFPVPCKPIPSRVDGDERKLYYNSGKDWQAEGWCFPVDSKWLHNFMATTRPANIEMSDEQYQSMYGEWDRVFESECPSGSTRALWGVNLILATRK